MAGRGISDWKFEILESEIAEGRVSGFRRIGRIGWEGKPLWFCVSIYLTGVFPALTVLCMQLERLTIKSQEALQEAQQIARGYTHQEVDGEHLLLAMIGQSESLIPHLLEKICLPGAKLKPDIERELARRHKVQG